MPLKLKRKKGSPYWYIRGTLKGVYVETSTGTGNREDAEYQRLQREKDILDEARYGLAATATFADAALSYMKAGGERRFINKLLDHFETTRLKDIGQQQANEAVEALYPLAAVSTVQRQLITPLKAVLRHAAAMGWCPQPFIKGLKQPESRIRWLTPDEAEKLINSSADHLKPIIIFLLGTGARVSECLYLDWKDVDLPNSRVVFLNTKNGTNRGLPLHPRVRSVLEAMPERYGMVFRRHDGKPYTYVNDRGGQIKDAFDRACSAAGIDNLTPHDLRHTWATWLYAATRDFIKLKQLGGWKTNAMVMRYAHVNPDHLKDAIAQLPWKEAFYGTEP